MPRCTLHCAVHEPQSLRHELRRTPCPSARPPLREAVACARVCAPHRPRAARVPPSPNAQAFKDGVAMFCAFAAFGMLPMVGFVAAGAMAPSLDESSLLSVACTVASALVFALGAFKARFHDKQYLRSGAETLVLGLVCAAVAFCVGRAVAHFAASSGIVLDRADGL